MPTLDDIAGVPGPLEHGARTPFEDTSMEQALIEDIKALEAAEARSKGLRKGEARWECPGCSMFWIGPQGSHAFKSYQAHRARHAHARPARALSEG